MGQEIECRLRLGKRALAGKAYLETDYVLFRGDERVKVAFKDLRSVTAAEGVLRLDFDGGPAELELGKAAEKWAAKILNPPSRADKLGIKAGVSVRLVGDFEPEFVDEVRGLTTKTTADLVFFAARSRADLKRVPSLVDAGSALWIVYPKGVEAIREVEVIEAGRAAGLKDVKVARFSETHTALKFVAGSGKR